MRCSECGVTVNPPAVLCPGCTYRASQLARMPKFSLATPSPINTTTDAGVSTKARKDIPWVAVILACLPFLVLGCFIASQKYAGIPGKAFGYAMGPAVWAAALAGLLGKFAKARFRLTFMVTFLVMEIMPLLDAASSINKEDSTEASPSSSAMEANAISLPARIDFEWPQGWRLQPVERVGSSGVSQAAALLKNGKAMATITVMVGRDDPTLTLADEAKISMESATETVKKAGGTVTWSPPSEGRVGNLPAIRQEANSINNHVKARQLVIYIDSPDRTKCALAYTAIAENFDGYKPLFDEALKRFTCPTTNTVAASHQ